MDEKAELPSLGDDQPDPTEVPSRNTLPTPETQRPWQEPTHAPVTKETALKTDWAKIIRERGGGYLHGKLLDEWLDPANQSAPSEAVARRDAGSPFHDAGNFGKVGESRRTRALAPRARNLLNEVLNNPDTIENVFQGSYPGLTERGVQRVQAPGFKAIQLRSPVAASEEKTQAAARGLRREAPIFLFSKPMGEQPLK